MKNRKRWDTIRKAPSPKYEDDVRMIPLRTTLSLFFLFLFSACAPHDAAYYLKRGEEVKRELVAELQTITTLPDLIERQSSLTALFDEMACLAIEASHVPSSPPQSTIVDPLSCQITDELRRIAQIPGAIACLEKCQAAAIERLDRESKMRKKAISLD